MTENISHIHMTEQRRARLGSTITMHPTSVGNRVEIHFDPVRAVLTVEERTPDGKLVQWLETMDSTWKNRQ